MLDAPEKSAHHLPPPADRHVLERSLERLADLVADGDDKAAQLQALYEGEGPASRLIAAVFGASPFLTDLILRDTVFALACLTGEPDDIFDTLIERMRQDVVAAEDAAGIKRALRQAKAKAALLIALADLSSTWPLEQVTARLTAFADTACALSVDWLLREAASQGKCVLADEASPSLKCGYVVLAMGKHGAYELNYSSDVDLIVLYDSETAPLATGTEPAKFFVRLTKRLVDLLQDMTEDGYVFRVDLRLRPDPRATQIAIGFEAACIYYENMGQNWERAAMIKARPIAGDLDLGAEFRARMVPYIWRKYLDFAAIADVQSLKRQIHSVKGHGSITVPGHNLKLGRGGIREIEFFVQTQQLIAGGRNPRLRGQQTLPMLDRLAEESWITPQTAAQLKAAYVLLRTLEHRVQMLNDEQTHALPAHEDELQVFAAFAGYTSYDAFADDVRRTLETVQKHYNALFEDAEELAAEAGSLVFTGGEDDPETVETLSRMGFTRPSDVSATIRGWHFGRYAATRTSIARERLTEIMPQLLRALANSGDPDTAFVAFDRFVAGLPAGVQLFSMLRANTHLLDLLALILGTAPRLAEQLSQRAKVLDAVLDPGFFDHLPDADEVAGTLDRALAGHAYYEERLDIARITGKELMFQVGVRVLSESLSAEQAGLAYSNIADALIARLLDAAHDNVAERHGRLPGGRVAVLAMGKLGGQEMTATSDVDLILIYDHPGECLGSDGEKPLSPQQYYSRLTQRLIAAISSQTAEGLLYEVDMRLRPSGNQGPVATSIASFREYHRTSAWTWEKLALTRARTIAGDPSLRDEVDGAVSEALTEARPRSETIDAIREMRQRIQDEYGTEDVWNLKHAPGGMVDCEFIVQGLQIISAHQAPEVLAHSTAHAIARLSQASALDETDRQTLAAANNLYHKLMQVLRLCVTDDSDPRQAPSGLARLLANAAACPDLKTTHSLLADTQRKVWEVFDRVLA
jgi:glutamate-ammonia-ligase adenylyltransferase